MSLFGGKKGGAGGSRPGDETRSTPSAGAGSTPRPGGANSGSKGTTDRGAHTTSAGGRPARSGGEGVTHIGRSVVLKGDLVGEEDLTIEGSVEGRIELPSSELTIGEHGRIRAEINAKDVIVIGEVTGNINASERVEIHQSGVVEGDIRSGRLLIHEGAVVNGAVDMSPPGSGGGGKARKSEASSAATVAVPANHS